ncbi:MAG: cistern family PEP-CTERM protein [Deltaproteobacteria bacterium]|nr:cistern family PEP-CTERM protein [Deltaproteobacteria bacterium]
MLGEEQMTQLRLLVLSLALFAAPALAAPVSVQVDHIGQSWSLDYNGIMDVNGVPTVLSGLTATIDFQVVDFFYDASSDASGLVIALDVYNTTDPTIWQRGAVSGIGFDTDPNVIRSWSSVSGYYNRLAFNTTLPTGAGFQVEICLSTKRSSCTGPWAAGNQVGTNVVQSAVVFLAFQGDVTGTGVTLDNFGIRYADLQSAFHGVQAGLGLGVPVAPIPEPASIAAFGLGALLTGASLRRRMRAN